MTGKGKKKYEPPSLVELDLDPEQAVGQTTCRVGTRAGGQCLQGAKAMVACGVGGKAARVCGVGGRAGRGCGVGSKPSGRLPF